MNARLEQLLRKRLNGSLTPEEEIELMRLLRDPENDAQLLDFIDLAYETGDDPDVRNSLSGEKSDRIFNEITSGYSEKGSRRLRPALWMAAAASLLVVLSVVLLLNRKDISSHGTSVAAVPAIPDKVISTSSDHQLVRLPDGSTVILNKNSRLSFPAKFTGKTREVTLIGEGYFDIASDRRKTFIVHTGKIQTVVLGTTFNIKAYRSDRNIDVTVTSGKVNVVADRRVLAELTPNQKISYSYLDSKSKKTRTNASEAIEWQSRDLFFDNVTMKEAATILEQRFHTRILFASQQTRDCRFSGTFLKGESLTQVLEVICAFNNCSYTTDEAGNTIISGEQCQTLN